MIRDITLDDEVYFKRLGLLINSKFNDVYNLKDEINRPMSIIKVYEDDNVIKGFVHIEDLGMETNVINIVVDEKYRRNHIADKLLDYVINKSKSEKIILEVSSNNLAAIELYSKHGFVNKGIRKGYYNGIDAITMVKEL